MLLVILGRVLFGVSANTVQKKLVEDRVGVSAIWLASYAMMLLPAVLLALIHSSRLTTSFATNVLLGGLLDVAGNLAMVAALRATDLSVFGPLNALRPVLALLFGWFFLAEIPSGPGFAGLGITVVGALLLLGNSGSKETRGMSRRQIRKVVSLRITGLSLSTLGAVFLKRAASHGTVEMTLAGWLFCGLVCLSVVARVRNRPPLSLLGQHLIDHGRWLALHAALFFIMQWLTISIFQQTMLAYSFVFFQLGMILQVIAGKVIFREPHFALRMAGCVVMCCGSALILWKG